MREDVGEVGVELGLEVGVADVFGVGVGVVVRVCIGASDGGVGVSSGFSVKGGSD